MFWPTLQLAWQELRANLLRSLLTTLGIVVGVAAVVIIVTLGDGVALRITDDIASMGRNMLFVAPFRPQRSGPAVPQTPFELGDADAIAREVQGVVAVAPTAQLQIEASNGTNHWKVTGTGTTPAYLEIREWRLAQGRGFTESELRGGRPVCLLGATPHRELFGAQAAVGATIRLGKTACQVIGLLESRGRNRRGPGRGRHRPDADPHGAAPADRQQYRYMRVAAGPVAVPQLRHGTAEQLTPAVKQTLKELYPDDKATGYKPGDIRGAMTIRKPL